MRNFTATFAVLTAILVACSPTETPIGGLTATANIETVLEGPFAEIVHSATVSADVLDGITAGSIRVADAEVVRYVIERDTLGMRIHTDRVAQHMGWFLNELTFAVSTVAYENELPLGDMSESVEMSLTVNEGWQTGDSSLDAIICAMWATGDVVADGCANIDIQVSKENRPAMVSLPFTPFSADFGDGPELFDNMAAAWAESSAFHVTTFPEPRPTANPEELTANAARSWQEEGSLTEGVAIEERSNGSVVARFGSVEACISESGETETCTAGS